MTKFLKKLAVRLGKAMLALVVLFAIFLGYGLFAERAASAKAAALCDSIAPGSDASALHDRAILDGADKLQTRWFKADGVDNLFITYVGLPPFSRHICRVKASNGRVVSATRSRLD